MTTRVAGLGAGGHARVLIEALRLGALYEVAGLMDADPGLAGSSVTGVPVLGDDRLLADLSERGIRHFFIGVGSTRAGAIRQRLYDLAVRNGLCPIQVVHPAAIVAPSAQVGPGAAILAGAIIGTAARLGTNVIVNTGAIVEHDSVLGDHAHVATGARLAGGVTVGENAFVGIGASIRQGVRIGTGATVGAGAVVVRDVPDGLVVIGVPARIMEPRSA